MAAEPQKPNTQDKKKKGCRSLGVKPRRSSKAGESRGMEIHPPALHSTSSSSAREVEMGLEKFPCKSLGRAGNKRGLLGSVSRQQGFSQASEIGSLQRLPSVTARASGSISFLRKRPTEAQDKQIPPLHGLNGTTSTAGLLP